MCAFQHFVFHLSKIVPPVLCLHIDLTEFPLPQRICLAPFEPSCLLILGYAEIKLDQDSVLPHQITLESHHTPHEIIVFLLGTETEHALHHGTVVPAAIKQHDFTGPGKLGNVFLVVPLGLLFLGRFTQGDDAVVLLVHVARYPPNGSALARGIPALEQYDHATALFLQITLDLQQLGLKRLQFLLPAIAPDRFPVGLLQACNLFRQFSMLPGIFLQTDRLAIHGDVLGVVRFAHLAVLLVFWFLRSVNNRLQGSPVVTKLLILSHSIISFFDITQGM